MLDAVGKTTVHGPSWRQTVKAANQLIVAGNIELLAEAIVFLQAYGVDTDAAVKVLGGSLAGSAVLNQKARKMLDRDFDRDSASTAPKDPASSPPPHEVGVVAPLGALVAQLMATARANGDGGLDHSGLPWRRATVRPDAELISTHCLIGVNTCPACECRRGREI